MIENIRKYSGLIMVVLVVSALAFILGDYNRSSHALDGGQGVIRVAGRTYSEKDFRNFGHNGYELTGALAGAGDYSLYSDFLIGMTSGATSKEEVPEKFFASRMIIRDAKEEFGIYPGDEEITGYLRSLRAFTGPDEKFSAEAYNNFIERFMGRLGMTEKDLRELVSDILTVRKLNEIVGSGLTADRDSAAKNLALQNQKISGEVAKLDLTPFEAKIEPTEDEIKKYWENIRDAFTTEPKRKFTYVIATPEAPIEVKNDTTPESIADATATDEVKKAAAKKKEEEKAKADAEVADDRRKKQLAIDKLVDDFLFNLEEQKGAGFEDLAKGNKWEVKTSEFFSKTGPPKDLDVTLRSSSRRGKAVDELFLIRETSDPFSKFS
ncbi:MAG: SurA N-terminal domain-containing protein, partial [Opitutaceae bacterium]|nr:SurA N-terminal domain-containing protein [Verrucomicrobiales bacterium]